MNPSRRLGPGGRPGDEVAFFEKAELLLEDPCLTEGMGLVAREFAAGMSWRATLDDLIASHSRLAGRRTTAARRRNPAPRL